MSFQFFNKSIISEQINNWVDSQGFMIVFSEDMHLLSDHPTRFSNVRESHSGQYTRLKNKLINCCNIDASGNQKLIKIYNKMDDTINEIQKHALDTSGAKKTKKYSLENAGIGEEYFNNVFNYTTTENLELRDNYDIVIIVRGNKPADLNPDNICGFMIIEYGECYTSENHNIPVLNLICTQSKSGEPIGRLLMYLYVYTLKYGYVQYPRGLLELANNYNNVGGLCLYNKFGFREDLSLKKKRLPENEDKEYYEEGEEVCFPDNDTLPMYINMGDPAIERRNINNALMNNINIPVTFDTNEPLCEKGSSIGPKGSDQPLAIVQRNENQQNIIHIQNLNPRKQWENVDFNKIAPGGNVIKKLANRSKAGQKIEIDPATISRSTILNKSKHGYDSDSDSDYDSSMDVEFGGAIKKKSKKMKRKTKKSKKTMKSKKSKKNKK